MPGVKRALKGGGGGGCQAPECTHLDLGRLLLNSCCSAVSWGLPSGGGWEFGSSAPGRRLHPDRQVCGHRGRGGAPAYLQRPPDSLPLSPHLQFPPLPHPRPMGNRAFQKERESLQTDFLKGLQDGRDRRVCEVRPLNPVRLSLAHRVPRSQADNVRLNPREAE